MNDLDRGIEHEPSLATQPNRQVKILKIEEILIVNPPTDCRAAVRVSIKQPLANRISASRLLLHRSRIS